ncbi:MAG: hypothetical protein HW386_2531 [Gammaproteobacteria bacterium]|nr:hypothetical protein [Gammaproteobacteria bacterium]
MFSKSFVVITLIVLGLGIAPYAGAAEEAGTGEGKARAEIQELMWRYVRALDTLDAEAYAQTYTEDGQFHSGPNAEKGRAALRQMIEGLRKDRADREAKGEPKSPPMYHMITNSYIELIDADHARYHSYWMTVFGAVGQDTPPRVAAAGRGVDELVRVDGKWLIKFRDVAPQD